MFCQSPKVFPLKAYKYIYTFSLFLFSTPSPITLVKKGVPFVFLHVSVVLHHYGTQLTKGDKMLSE